MLRQLETPNEWMPLPPTVQSNQHLTNGFAGHPTSQPTSHASVLSERPDADRTWTPETGVVLWYCMAAGLAVLIGVGIWYWLGEKLRRIERSNEPGQDGEVL